jgi:hypothetical protein
MRVSDRFVVGFTTLVVWVCTSAAIAAAAVGDNVPAVGEAPSKALVADGIATWSVDGGGGASSGGSFGLTAAVGQPDAGMVSRCSTVLDGGLWAGAVDLQAMFCNGFESGGTGAWSSAVGGTGEEGS